MLAHSAMNVVITLVEKIRLGTLEKVTAEANLKIYPWRASLTCHSDEFDRNIKVKRGKPLKRETQILVEEIREEKDKESSMVSENLDKWLHKQNMAYELITHKRTLWKRLIYQQN